MKKHEHHDCDHDIKFCRPCNEAYCEKCPMVWNQQPCTLNHYPYQWWYTTPTYPRLGTPMTPPFGAGTVVGIASGTTYAGATGAHSNC